MKKFGLAIAAACLLFASCTSVLPLTATSNSLGSKVGESSVTYLFGVFALGNTDASIQSAAKKGGITKISTVDAKLTHGFAFFTTTITTVVTGE